MQILDHSGHTTLLWDTEDATDAQDKVVPGESTKLDPAYVESEFNRLVSEGWLAYAEVTTKEGKSENVQIKKRPTEYESVILTPQFVGG